MEHPITINGIDVRAQYSERAVKEIFLPLLKKLKDLRQEKGGRALMMLAAPPGAGKSTLLSFLERLAREQGMEGVQSIGMDGFHRRQEYLLSHQIERDGRLISMVAIKGAPITFDLESLTERVERVAAGETCGWPKYDRLLHNPVENALLVHGDIVLLEGNYLLLDVDGWRDLKSFADYTVSIRADEGLLRDRLIERRIKTGVEKDAATQFVDFSDIPNVRLCLEKTMPADVQLTVDGQGDYHIASITG
ncbi:MAG: nucleoside/nucleotide kinase family protein [Clostridia bacterium]|nr:nucleoside/nucleotide kinase family protein [Clostridia bacterium]